MSSALSCRSACCAFLLTLLVPLGAAEAGSKSAKDSAAAGQALPASQMAPLTASECKRLGGRVSNDANCKAGKECTTQTLDGAWHTACITEVE
ncbi:MAG TPA: hypothetical protein VM144_18745 [Aestuariivirga sp.]|nr:hypothetical protein [Aestuariivirga sp.]